MKLMYEDDIKVDFRCTHPELENNTCPMGWGECPVCNYCMATMKAADLFRLKKREAKK